MTAMTQMRSYVATTVDHHRERGIGMQRAWFEAARRLGITPRRVRAFLNGEARSVSADEFLRAQRAHADLLCCRAAALRAELAQIETLLESRKHAPANDVRDGTGVAR